MEKMSLNGHYGKWLGSMEWDFYCTLTTDRPMSLAYARRIMERFQTGLIKRAGSSQIFWVAEPFDLKEGYHTHALIHLPEAKEVSVKKKAGIINNLWQRITGARYLKSYNRTEIQPFIKDKGAEFYVGKYLQRTNADYDFLFLNSPDLKSNPEVEPPQAELRKNPFK
jgi:hypothetical protein